MINILVVKVVGILVTLSILNHESGLPLLSTSFRLDSCRAYDEFITPGCSARRQRHGRSQHDGPLGGVQKSGALKEDSKQQGSYHKDTHNKALNFWKLPLCVLG